MCSVGLKSKYTPEGNLHFNFGSLFGLVYFVGFHLSHSVIMQFHYKPLLCGVSLISSQWTRELICWPQGRMIIKLKGLFGIFVKLAYCPHPKTHNLTTLQGFCECSWSYIPDQTWAKYGGPHLVRCVSLSGLREDSHKLEERGVDFSAVL